MALPEVKNRALSNPEQESGAGKGITLEPPKAWGLHTNIDRAGYHILAFPQFPHLK